MVLEYMEGGTLSEAKEGHDFNESEVAYVAREILTGISFLHTNHLIHRDLKSESKF
jgi:serine/threonine protein kinase